MDIIKKLVPVLTVVGLLFGGFFVLESRPASSEEFQLFVSSTNVQLLQQRHSFLLNLLWKYEAKYGQNLERADNLTKQEYQRIKNELESVKKKLEKYYSKG